MSNLQMIENAPKLRELAKHANNGACNPLALIHGLSEAVMKISQQECRDSIEVRIILGQITFLLGESAGPTSEAMKAYYDATNDIKI